MPFRTSPAVVCLALASLVAVPHHASSGAEASRFVTGSVRLPDADGRSIGSARILRTTLAPAELSAPMVFSVTLRMRDFAGLQARVAAGEQIQGREMEAKYLPLAADYNRAAAWLAGQGFAESIHDRTHTSLFVRGTVAGVARAFGVQFARVSTSDGEYTSAVSEPSVPADLADVVLSVNGLQPQLRIRHASGGVTSAPRDIVEVYVTPINIAYAYDFPVALTGAGQIIAIVGEAPPAPGDAATFWSRTTPIGGVSQTEGNLTMVPVPGDPVESPTTQHQVEACADVEWAGAMAPGAGIRLYLAQDFFSCFTQIQDDLPDYPNMSVVSVSYGTVEVDQPPATIQAYSQTFASLAAAGVSILVSSGDSGSNPTKVSPGYYSPSAPLSVAYPASDPSVTGVGGTTLDFTGGFTVLGEVAWDDLAPTSPNTPLSATGGGLSAVFSKPAWQTGGAFLAGQTMRCVPDVAAISTSQLTNVDVGSGTYSSSGGGALVVENGAYAQFIGTSLATPIWAAAIALLNEERAMNGMGPIGLLNPHLYPLAGTNSFNDIVSGSNGAYNAGPGYDLCTGIGSPRFSELIGALSNPVTSRKIVNLSARAEVGTGANALFTGFVIQGPPGSVKGILVRGVGPALAPFGLTGVLQQPVLSVYDSNSVLIAINAGWGNFPTPGTSDSGALIGQATGAEMSAAGAFSLPAGSGDSAMLLILPPGSYSMQVSGVGGTSGVAMSEIYDLNASVPAVITNFSNRCYVGTGANVEVSGFVVEGNLSANLLIRGIGPALAGFGLSGVLAQPTISLYDSGNNLIASNSGWGSAVVVGTSSTAATWRQATAADMTSAGAFPLTTGSSDSAMVVSLPPGAYTVVMAGVGASTGTGLAEVYELSGP